MQNDKNNMNYIWTCDVSADRKNCAEYRTDGKILFVMFINGRRKKVPGKIAQYLFKIENFFIVLIYIFYLLYDFASLISVVLNLFRMMGHLIL